jgi:hypothetical protein
VRDPTIEEEREEEGRRLRQQLEIREEFEGPGDKAKRIAAERKRIQKQIALERASKLAPEELREDVVSGTITPLSGYAASQRKGREREADIKSANLEMTLVHALLESGKSMEEAMPEARQAVDAGQAAVMLSDIRRRRAATLKAQEEAGRRSRLAGTVEGDLKSEDIPPLIRSGDLTYTQGRSLAQKKEKEAKKASVTREVNNELAEFLKLDSAMQEAAEELWRAEAAGGDEAAELKLQRLDKLRSREEKAFYRY